MHLVHYSQISAFRNQHNLEVIPTAIEILLQAKVEAKYSNTRHHLLSLA